jgi:hypothetical protein
MRTHNSKNKRMSRPNKTMKAVQVLAWKLSKKIKKEFRKEMI